MRLSYSKLSLYDQCPRLYKARRLDGVPELPSEPLVVGVIMHKAVQLYLNHLSRKRLRADLGYIKKAVTCAYSDHTVVSNTDYFDQAYDVTLRWARDYEHDYDNTVEVEGWFERALGMDVVVGVIDRLYLDGDTIVFRDYKSGYSSEMSAEYDLQRLMYGWLIKGRYPHRPIAGEYEFVRSRTITPRMTFTDRDFEVAEMRMRAIAARIIASRSQEHWPATPGKQCAYCPVSVRCDVLKKLGASQQIIANPETAVEGLSEHLVLEAAIAKSRDNLKNYTGQNGPVSVGGRRAAFVTRERQVVRNARGLLDALGDQAYDYLTVDNRALPDRFLTDERTRHLVSTENVVEFKIVKE